MSNNNGLKFIGFIILLLGLAAGAYFLYSNLNSNEQPTETVTTGIAGQLGALTPTASVLNSPVSPLSPVVTSQSSATPIDTTSINPPLDLEELFRKIDQAEQAYNENEIERAFEIINEVISVDKRNPFAFNTRGNIYVSQQRFNEALSDYNRGIQLDPGLSPLYYNRGRLYATLNNYDAALADLERSAQLNGPEFGYRAKGNIGRIYDEMGEYNNALEAYNESITFDGTKADVYYLRGQTYLALNNYEAAIADFEAAIERFPSYDAAYRSLGYAYFKVKNYEFAQNALDEALEISPDDPIALWYKVLTNLAVDRPDQAQSIADRAMVSLSETSDQDKNKFIPQILDELESLTQQNPGQAELINSFVSDLANQ